MKNLLDQLSKENREVVNSSKCATVSKVRKALKANSFSINLKLEEVVDLWWTLNPMKPFNLTGFYNLFIK